MTETPETLKRGNSEDLKVALRDAYDEAGREAFEEITYLLREGINAAQGMGEKVRSASIIAFLSGVVLASVRVHKGKIDKASASHVAAAFTALLQSLFESDIEAMKQGYMVEILPSLEANLKAFEEVCAEREVKEQPDAQDAPA